MFDFANYINPGLLWLMVGALAPIIIHLAARSRPKHTPFPAVRFILASHRKSSAKFRLKQLLLLLLRVGALAVFAFVLARPWVKGSAADVSRAKTTVTAVLLVDTSYSMGYRQGGTTSFEKAREMALAAADGFLPGESRACLMLVTDTPQPVISDFKHAYDLAALKKYIGEARLSSRGTNCTLAVKEAVAMLRKVTGVSKSVFLFTDMTARSWPDPVPAGDAREDITIYIADVGPEKPVNPAVLGAVAPANAAPGVPFEVRARVDAVGSAGRQAELVIDGETRGRKAASAHQVEQLTFIASAEKPAAEHWGRVSMTGPDDLGIDNTFSFTFRSTRALRVVLVNGAPAAVPRRDELFYLRTALAPGGMTAGQVFEVVEMKPGDLESSELPEADVAAFCNVGALSAAAWTKVRRFVSSGRGLVVFAGENVTAAAYAAVSKGETAVLPCEIGESASPADGVRLEPGKLRHPILAQFQGGRNGDLVAAKFNTYVKLRPSDKVANEVVLAFKNNDPALVAGSYGAGKVLVFASTCDADWNTLPQEVPYPVLIHEAFRFLAVWRQEQRDVLVGSAPLLAVPMSDSVRTVSLSRVPDGAAQDVTGRLDRRTGRLGLQPIEEPGLYRVEVKRQGGGPSDELFLAVNVDTAESNLARVGRESEAVKALLPGRAVKVSRTTNELLDQISRSESVSEGTSHLAGIVLGILIGEMFLSNRMRARAREAVAAG